MHDASPVFPFLEQSLLLCSINVLSNPLQADFMDQSVRRAASIQLACPSSNASCRGPGLLDCWTPGDGRKSSGGERRVLQSNECAPFQLWCLVVLPGAHLLVGRHEPAALVDAELSRTWDSERTNEELALDLGSEALVLVDRVL